VCGGAFAKWAAAAADTRIDRKFHNVVDASNLSIDKVSSRVRFFFSNRSSCFRCSRLRPYFMAFRAMLFLSKNTYFLIDRCILSSEKCAGHDLLLRCFSRWRFHSFRVRWSKASHFVTGQRRVVFLKQKLYFQLWKNRFIYSSRCVLIQSVFTARRHARAVASAFRCFRNYRHCLVFPSQNTLKRNATFLVTRFALNRDFFFSSNVFSAWRRAVRHKRRMLLAQSHSFAMRPMLLQWHALAVQARPSTLPTRAMHFSDLLRAQSMSRQILLQPSALLALRKQSQDESALSRPYWSEPLLEQQSVAAIALPQHRLAQPHIISAKISPSRPLSERLPPKTIRNSVPVRPPWIPANVAVAATTEFKRHTGPR
jgi:hypothetical protein